MIGFAKIKDYAVIGVGAAALMMTALASSGCNQDTGRPHQSVESKPDKPVVSQLEQAVGKWKSGDLDEAAKLIGRVLIESPDDPAASLIASQIEASRGNHETAIDLASSVDIRSKLGRKAVVVRLGSLSKLRRFSEATDLLLEMIGVEPQAADWRHQAWAVLNFLGRREEASRQAIGLCQMGEATRDELLSLISRTAAFPPNLKAGVRPESVFHKGLGIARWHFTQGEFQKALDELKPEFENGFESKAALALYGRLLAEAQDFESMPVWYAKCDEEVRQLGDYWVALGTYLFDQRDYQGCAHALLTGISINPTDRVCSQRIGKVMRALERLDDGEQFIYRGIQIADTEATARALMTESGPKAKLMMKVLVRQVLALNRPFETVGWTRLMLPANAANLHANLTQKRISLLQSKDTMRMASVSALLGIEPEQFAIEPSIKKLTQAVGQNQQPKKQSVATLAIPKLSNVAKDCGLEFQWYKDVEIDLSVIPLYQSLGGGIAVIDYDQDGWPDVYAAQGAGEPPTDRCARSNQMFRNVDARFASVTEHAKCEDYNYSCGVAVGDLNQDGFPDLYLGSLGHNRVLINNGDGSFHEMLAISGNEEDKFTSTVAIADITGDGLADLFEANYIEMEGGFRLPEVGEDGKLSLPSPLKHYADSDRWFKCGGDGSFHVQTIPRDVASPGSAMGVVITDFDSDGKNDVFVGNDVRPNHFLVQSANESLANVADAFGIANGFTGAANGCMGIATGDFNRDGLIDLHIANYYEESANLYVQDEGGGFRDLAIRFGLKQSSFRNVGFGTKAVDLDRNGWLDLVVTNGHIFDMRPTAAFRMPPQLLLNRGARFELTKPQDDSGYWSQEYLGRAISTLDYNRDGATDFLIGHMDQPMAILENQTVTNGESLQFEFVGTKTERDAIGVRVVVTVNSRELTHWVTAGDGYLSSDEPVVDFGLGENADVEKVVVHWPSGETQVIPDAEAGQRYLVVEGKSIFKR